MRSSLAVSKPTEPALRSALSLPLGFAWFGARFTATFAGIVPLNQYIRKIVVGWHPNHTGFVAFQDQRVAFGLAHVSNDALHALDDLFGELTFFGSQLALELHVGLLQLGERFLCFFGFL